MWREFYRYLTRHVQPLRPAAGRAGPPPHGPGAHV